MTLILAFLSYLTSFQSYGSFKKLERAIHIWLMVSIVHMVCLANIHSIFDKYTKRIFESKCTMAHNGALDVHQWVPLHLQQHTKCTSGASAHLNEKASSIPWCNLVLRGILPRFTTMYHMIYRYTSVHHGVHDLSRSRESSQYNEILNRGKKCHLPSQVFQGFTEYPLVGNDNC